MRQVPLKDVPKGTFVRRKADAKTTFVRGEYCRFDRKYSLTDFYDINREVMLKGTTLVFIDFEF